MFLSSSDVGGANVTKCLTIFFYISIELIYSSNFSRLPLGICQQAPPPLDTYYLNWRSVELTRGTLRFMIWSSWLARIKLSYSHVLEKRDKCLWNWCWPTHSLWIFFVNSLKMYYILWIICKMFIFLRFFRLGLNQTIPVGSPGFLGENHFKNGFKVD